MNQFVEAFQPNKRNDEKQTGPHKNDGEFTAEKSDQRKWLIDVLEASIAANLLNSK